MTWARMRDFSSYGTGLSLDMRTVLCDGISIVFHPRLPSGTLLTDVECGRATRTPASCELSNRCRRGLYRYTPWTNRRACRLTGWWQLLLLLRWDRAISRCCCDVYFQPHRCRPCCPGRYPRSWRFCWNACCQECRPRRRHRRPRLGLREWRPCYSAYFRGTGSCSQGLVYDSVFFLWQIGPWGGQVPRIGGDIPVHVAGMVGGEGGWQLHDDLTP